MAAVFFPECKKDSVSSNLASVNITNAITGGAILKYGANSSTIANNSYVQFKVGGGSNNIYVYAATDSLHPYFNQTMDLENGGVYSLFLLGGLSAAIEGLLIKDTIPFQSDSTAGVRFVNLSSNSNLLNVSLSTTPTVMEVSNLGYKQYTSFKTYPAKSSNANYIFQIRKASDNSILTTYTLSTPRFANVTLVIRGVVGTTPALGITRVNNDR